VWIVACVFFSSFVVYLGVHIIVTVDFFFTNALLSFVLSPVNRTIDIAVCGFFGSFLVYACFTHSLCCFRSFTVHCQPASQPRSFLITSLQFAQRTCQYYNLPTDVCYQGCLSPTNPPTYCPVHVFLIFSLNSFPPSLPPSLRIKVHPTHPPSNRKHVTYYLKINQLDGSLIAYSIFIRLLRMHYQ
jgi:hypothetical protein